MTVEWANWRGGPVSVSGREGAGGQSVARSAVNASGTYFVAQALLILAGLISMPVMTRLLSLSQYGLLSVIFTTASALGLVGGLGFGEATVRLYSEYARQGRAALQGLCESVLSGAFVASALVALAGVLIVAMLRDTAAPISAPAVAVAGLLVIVRAVSNVVFQLYRAQGRAVAYAAAQLAIRYGTMLVAIAALLVWTRTAYAVVASALLVEALVLASRLADLRRRGWIARPRLSPAVRSALAYGSPLVLGGVARFLLSYGDRWLIQWMVGLEAVAVYSVPYDLAHRLGDALTLPVQLAIVPMLFHLWAQEGRHATSRMASRVLTYLVAVGLPVTALYLMYSQPIVVLLASAKYEGAAALTPYLLPGVLFDCMTFIVAVGLTVEKRTVRLALNVCAAAAVNLLLDLVLIPIWHLTGAAIATTVGSAVLFAAHYVTSRGSIRLRIDRGIVARSALATGAVVAGLAFGHRIPSHGAQDLVLSLAGGGGAALLLFAASDSGLRGLLRPLLRGARAQGDA